ncbi:Acriflavin resistance protein [hydrothermal vent metagenome]|uniref:Acriflavin resistance protein n=1 Tax=hydrothermal vent metagenome TaxID=652676 RepID=A0A3B0RX59_9ZZZZ
MTADQTSQLRSLSIDRTAMPGKASLWPAILAGALGALIAGLAVWLWMNAQLKQAKTAAQAAAEIAAQSQPDNNGPTVPRASGLVASGYVVARRKATVSAEITGVIREILFEEGSQVKAGQVLARLDDERARIALTQLKAVAQSSKRNIQSLAAQITEAEIVLHRAKTLAAKSIGSQAAVTAAEASLAIFQAQLQGGKADLAANQANIASQQDLVERYVIRAPFTGVVIAKNAQMGEILSPSSAGGGFTRTGIATLVDMQSLEIEVDVNEGQIGRIRQGQKVEAVLDAYQDWKIPAKVIAIIPTADRARATIKVRVALEQMDARVLPDMATKVTFIETTN